MPALTNPRHERFAQDLAMGSTQEAAYVAAGYRANDGNACKLAARQEIQARVKEITGRAAMRAEISVASVTANLERIASKAEQLEGGSGLNTARQAWMDAAKLNGLIVDRAENTNVNYDVTAEPASADEWAAEHVTPH